MSAEPPPRLKDDPALGPVLRAGDPAGLAPDRLAAGGAAVRAAIASGAAPASSAAWKWLVPPLALIGIATAIVVGRDAGDGERVVTTAPPPVAPAPSPSIEATPDADVITTAAAIVAAPVPEPAPAAIEPRPRKPRTEPDPAAAPVPAPPASDLPEQIRLYEEARAAGARREFTVGLERLAELLQRFPATPLRADAELTRAELLARADRLDEAATALEGLAADPAHAGRRAELLRTLGDVHRQRGDCTSALAAYGRARDAGPSARQATAIDRGIARCSDAP